MSLNNSHLININSCIKIKSYTSDDLYYISILYNINKQDVEFNCTCGLKYNKIYRNNCKHIKDFKKNIIDKYNFEKDEKDKINNILSDLTDIKIN